MKKMSVTTIDRENLSLLIDKERIREAVSHLANRIYEDLHDEMPVFVCVLKGAFVFASDLMRAYPGLCEISFIRLFSYEGSHSTGEVKKLMDLTDNIEGRSVVIVEDIIDTGRTMDYLVKYLYTLNPKQVKVAALFTKPCNHLCEVQVDYHCFDIPDRFIIGYGMDCDGLYRNLPGIYTKNQQEKQ